MRESLDQLQDGVSGTAEAEYDHVVAAFREGIPDPGRSGAALSIWRDGREVVNVWAGMADERSGRRWDGSTLNVLFSCSKGLAAIVLARLHADARIDLLAPIGEVWPEFAAHGKGTISIADVLAHRGGVSAPVNDLSLATVVDGRRFAELIAAQSPLWQPGTSHAYHAITYGTIAQELVRRVTGRELHEVFRDEIASPLGADVTLKADAEHLQRLTYLTTTSDWSEVRTGGTPTDDDWIGRALSLGGALPRALVDGDSGFNDPRVLTAGLAGAGAVGTASGLARIWSATVVETSGMRLLSDADLQRICAPRSEGPWFFDPKPPYHRWGTGVQLSSDVTPWLSPDSFGHDGAGGQSGFADPNYGVSVGYVRNRMDLPDPVAPILKPLKAVLGA